MFGMGNDSGSQESLWSLGYRALKEASVAVYDYVSYRVATLVPSEVWTLGQTPSEPVTHGWLQSAYTGAKQTIMAPLVALAHWWSPPVQPSALSLFIGRVTTSAKNLIATGRRYLGDPFVLQKHIQYSARLMDALMYPSYLSVDTDLSANDDPISLVRRLHTFSVKSFGSTQPQLYAQKFVEDITAQFGLFENRLSVEQKALLQSLHTRQLKYSQMSNRQRELFIRTYNRHAREVCLNGINDANIDLVYGLCNLAILSKANPALSPLLVAVENCAKMARLYNAGKMIHLKALAWNVGKKLVWSLFPAACLSVSMFNNTGLFGMAATMGFCSFIQYGAVPLSNAIGLISPEHRLLLQFSKSLAKGNIHKADQIALHLYTTYGVDFDLDLISEIEDTLIDNVIGRIKEAFLKGLRLKPNDFAEVIESDLSGDPSESQTSRTPSIIQKDLADLSDEDAWKLYQIHLKMRTSFKLATGKIKTLKAMMAKGIESEEASRTPLQRARTKLLAYNALCAPLAQDGARYYQKVLGSEALQCAEISKQERLEALQTKFDEALAKAQGIQACRLRRQIDSLQEEINRVEKAQSQLAPF